MGAPARRTLTALWPVDPRPALLRVPLWPEDVEGDRNQPEPVSAHTFCPRGTARCLATTAAATALGTRLFGGHGLGAGKDKQAYNQAKKQADAISAYIMSEGLWALTRSIPENHALMVSLGEGLMPKAGETPEMGANPLLGFGRVYARPHVAELVESRVHRLLNDPTYGWRGFYKKMRDQRIKIWGGARMVENDPALIERLFDQGYKARPERAILFTIEAWDVNCSSHIVTRFTEEGIKEAIDKISGLVASRAH
mgnify:CR=1 FL=1